MYYSDSEISVTWDEIEQEFGDLMEYLGLHFQSLVTSWSSFGTDTLGRQQASPNEGSRLLSLLQLSEGGNAVDDGHIGYSLSFEAINLAGVEVQEQRADESSGNEYGSTITSMA